MSSPRVVLIGATGAVGSRALQHLLDDAVAARITVIGRRAPFVTHERLNAVTSDLKRDIEAVMPDVVDVAISCLGTTMKVAGSKEAFFAVDHDAVVNFARAAHARGARRFILVSSLGATIKTASFYLKTKGQVEAAVGEIGFVDVEILRPSVLDDEGSRATHRAGERMAISLMNALTAVIGKQNKYAPISVDVVGKVIAKLATAPLQQRRHVLESDEIHRLGDENDATKP